MLAIGPKTKQIILGPLKPLTRDDLAVLAKPRDQAVWQPKTLRDSHHRIARMFASGMRNKEIADLTGYTSTRLAILRRSPAMEELVAEYRKRVDEAWMKAQDAYAELAVSNMVAAERHIADAIDDLDEQGELLPIRTALAISRDAADRFGYHKKATNFNVNADFAKLLEDAIKRSGKVAPEGLVSTGQGTPMKLVEAVAGSSDPSTHTTTSSPSLAPKIARRI